MTIRTDLCPDCGHWLHQPQRCQWYDCGCLPLTADQATRSPDSPDPTTATGQRELVAQWMIRHGYSTGHGDTLTDLLEELATQLPRSPDSPDPTGGHRHGPDEFICDDGDCPRRSPDSPDPWSDLDSLLDSIQRIATRRMDERASHSDEMAAIAYALKPARRIVLEALRRSSDSVRTPDLDVRSLKFREAVPQHEEPTHGRT
jgi:hypothetical protein